MAKILAIDDKQDVLDSLIVVVEDQLPKCQVCTAGSGPEGLKKAKAELPDTILLDIRMPEMDGFEVCKRLKADKDTRHIPVIILTGVETDSESRVRALELGADLFLTKPFNVVELVTHINAMLKIKKSEDLLRQEKGLLEEAVQERTRELQKAHDELEQRVKERTSQLARSNKQLKKKIEERRQMEEERRRLEAQLLQAQRLESIGSLAGGIAHDFNNILANTRGFIELAIREAPGKSSVEKHLKGALRGINRAADLVKQILAFSQQSEPERRPVLISPIAEEVVSLLGASLPQT